MQHTHSSSLVTGRTFRSPLPVGVVMLNQGTDKDARVFARVSVQTE